MDSMQDHEFTRRDLLGGIVKGSAIAAAIGAVGADALGVIGETTPALAQDDPRPQPSNVIGDAWSNNQGRFTPGTAGNASVAEGGYAMDLSGFNYPVFSAEGCGNFTSYALGRKVGALGPDIQIDKWLQGMINNGLISYENFANIPNSAASFGIEHRGNRGAANLESVKAAWNEGLVSVVWMHQAGPHFVLIDYVEGDNIFIVDSGSWAYATLNEYLNNGYSISDHHVMMASKPAKDLPRLSKGEGGGSGAAKEEEEKRVVAAGGIVKEEDLKGMKHYKELKAQYDFMSTKGQKGGDSAPPLGIADTKKVEELNSAINYGKKTPQDYLGVGVSFVGLLGMVYSMFMFMSFLFDRSNNIVDANLLRKLTFGKMEAVQDNDDVREEGGVRYVSWKGILTWTGLCILISMLLLTGALFDFISWVAKIVIGE